MSRVREALRRANAMQATATAVADQPERQLETVKLSELLETFELPSQEEEALVAETEIPAIARTSRTNPMLRARWVRRLLRLAGLRPRGPIPTCGGVTRRGQPCRGLAMANGLCRLHGGSRSGEQDSRNLLGRLFGRGPKAVPSAGRL